MLLPTEPLLQNLPTFFLLFFFLLAASTCLCVCVHVSLAHYTQTFFKCFNHGWWISTSNLIYHFSFGAFICLFSLLFFRSLFSGSTIFFVFFPPTGSNFSRLAKYVFEAWHSRYTFIALQKIPIYSPKLAGVVLQRKRFNFYFALVCLNGDALWQRVIEHEIFCIQTCCSLSRSIKLMLVLILLRCWMSGREPESQRDTQRERARTHRTYIFQMVILSPHFQYTLI